MTQPPLDNPADPTQQGAPEPAAPHQPPAGAQYPPADPTYPGYPAGPAGPAGPQFPGQQFAPGPAGYPGYPGYSPPFNTNSIIAFVLAVAVFPPLGIFFGYKARAQIAETGERGREFATVGIVVGWIFTAVIVLTILAVCGAGALAGSANTY